MELNIETWKAYRHLQNLKRFRESGFTLDAGNDWLDKEISDIEADLQAEKKQSPGLGAGRLQALINIIGFIISQFKSSCKGAGCFDRIEGRYRADKLRRDG